MKGQKGRITMGHRKTFGSGGYVQYLDCGGSLKSLYIYAKLIRLYTLSIRSLSNDNYISIIS